MKAELFRVDILDGALDPFHSCVEKNLKTKPKSGS